MHTDWDEADNDTREAIATLHTDGGGYWSSKAKTVRITELALRYLVEDEDDGRAFGELAVHFNTDDWRPDKDGLIYTDDLFKAELRDYATSIGLAGHDINYSEQGMQGDNYVSCDVGHEFLMSWKAKYPDNYAELLEKFN